MRIFSTIARSLWTGGVHNSRQEELNNERQKQTLFSEAFFFAAQSLNAGQLVWIVILISLNHGVIGPDTDRGEANEESAPFTTNENKLGTLRRDDFFQLNFVFQAKTFRIEGSKLRPSSSKTFRSPLSNATQPHALIKTPHT